MFNQTKLEKFLIYKKNYLIFFFWLVSSIFFYFYIYDKYGQPPRYGMYDWNRYYDGAKDLLEFNIPDWPAYYFLSYCLYLALSVKIFFPYFTLILALIINLISSFLVYNICNKLFNNTAAFICLLVFLFYPYYQMWVFFIQPVSFFSFCLLFVLYSVVNYEHSKNNILILIFSLILVFTARPNGISEIISVYVFLIIFYLFYNKKISLGILILGIPIIYFLLIFLSNSMSIQNVYDAWYVTELKEFGFKTTKLNLSTTNFASCLGLSENDILNLNNQNAPKSNLYFWLCSLFISPMDVIKIFITRFLLTLSFYKPILSNKHNIFSLISLIPLYILFLVGFFCNFKLKKIFIIISILLILPTIFIHVADGDNRVFSAFFPFIFVLASGGFTILLKKIKILN